MFLRQRHRLATEQEGEAIGSYERTSYCAEGYSENVSDQYHAEVPPWVTDSARSHWQHSGYAVELLQIF